MQSQQRLDRPLLRLVGNLYQGPPDKNVPFLSHTFSTFSEIKHAPLTRQVQYASGSTDDDYIHFLGVEVEQIEDVPDGLIAWDIDGDSWRAIKGNAVIWEDSLTWQWLDESVPSRPCGEFSANCPEEWGSPRDFRIVSNGYIGAPCNDDILLVDYDPSWPQKYVEMRHRLLERLGPQTALRIEHYGSTAIPGMPAKPVIDILVEVPSFDEARRRVIPILNSPEIEYWCSDHMRFYIRDKVTGVRTCHLHMAPAGHRIWEGLIFRDYLRTHPEDASRYAALKCELAECYPTDRSAYTDAKDEFVREILEKAAGAR